jgi:hypothetical protein
VQFADIAVNDLTFDRLVTFGAYEDLVSNIVVRNGFPREHLINLGERNNPTIEQIVTKTVLEMPTDEVMLVGFVNIHTAQAEMLLEFFERAGETDTHHGRPHLIAVA